MVPENMECRNQKHIYKLAEKNLTPNVSKISMYNLKQRKYYKKYYRYYNGSTLQDLGVGKDFLIWTLYAQELRSAVQSRT